MSKPREEEIAVIAEYVGTAPPSFTDDDTKYTTTTPAPAPTNNNTSCVSSTTAHNNGPHSYRYHRHTHHGRRHHGGRVLLGAGSGAMVGGVLLGPVGAVVGGLGGAAIAKKSGRMGHSSCINGRHSRAMTDANKNSSDLQPQQPIAIATVVSSKY